MKDRVSNKNKILTEKQKGFYKNREVDNAIVVVLNFKNIDKIGIERILYVNDFEHKEENFVNLNFALIRTDFIVKKILVKVLENQNVVKNVLAKIFREVVYKDDKL